MLEIQLNGVVVAQSKNLKGVINYARKHKVFDVVVNHHADEKDGKYPVYFLFSDGAIGSIGFDDSQVAIEWVLARRSWGTFEVYNDPIATSFYYR